MGSKCSKGEELPTDAPRPSALSGASRVDVALDEFEVLPENKIANYDLVSQVFKTWLQFFYYEFKEFEEEWFIKTKDIPKPLPKCFRNPIMEKVRVIIGM